MRELPEDAETIANLIRAEPDWRYLDRTGQRQRLWAVRDEADVARIGHLIAEDVRPDWAIIRSLFKFGLPTGIQGIAMNVGGVLMLAFVGSLAQSAAAQAAFAVSYNQLFSFVTWTSIGLMGAAAAVAGQNLGAGRPDRTARAVHIAARLLGPAEGSQVVVTKTVRDLVTGTDLEFHPLGAATLRGVPGEWELFEAKTSDR